MNDNDRLARAWGVTSSEAQRYKDEVNALIPFTAKPPKVESRYDDEGECPQERFKKAMREPAPDSGFFPR